MQKDIDSKFAISFLIVVFIMISGYVIFISRSISLPSLPPLPQISFPEPPITLPFLPRRQGLKDIKKFSSEQEFKAYLEESEISATGYYGGLGFGGVQDRIMIEQEIGMPAPSALSLEKGTGTAPERVSTTTVQVMGVDEPDILKTDSKEIYFSSEQSYYWRESGILEVMPDTGITIPPQTKSGTKLVKAFPPAGLALDSEIEKAGNLLLHENTLIVFTSNEIFGFDVSNPKSSQKKWEIKLEDRNYFLSARLYKGKIYLITRNQIDAYHPCPIKPMTVGGKSISIECSDIYHPVVSVPTDATFTLALINLASGDIEKTTSFTGSSNSSVVYVSENAAYITYYYPGDFIKLIHNFFYEKCADIIPGSLIQKLANLMEYDISNTAKLTELQMIFENYLNSLSDDERMRIENELANRMEDYYKSHKRELENTGIVKIRLDNLEILAHGSVPGMPLNQFSLDEYNDYLRIATTIGESWGTGESANDVYVLDKDLKVAGAVKDLGLEERIYSVRFIEDKGYLVTFRQIDPFFVLDLSDPKKPQLKGELKIPGYSSYLHPVTKDKILGIGKEGSQVKISLFDVSNPSEPKEASKYTLDEYWSDILDTHHAFLLDSKHEIFFMPGSKGGYIFSYKSDKLELKRAVSNIRARRAIYIDDYLYIVGDDRISVLNEISWEEVKKLEF